jgi:hypothetical protein
MSHSQNANSFVCGLSTRKIRPPLSTQNKTMSRSAAHNAVASAQPKSGLRISEYFLGGFSAYWIEPSRRRLHQHPAAAFAIGRGLDFQGASRACSPRVGLAATLSASYGIYNGFELLEHEPIPGTEEYLDSQK